ncbi:hypothetical protein Cyrtocomes_00004 [Candidatus Cyrtobacter comes]|uniref:Thiaminase-2/PQQC domain-containing protein n=1 Tax=Candidatus Cyrtobacter comes TaxID=675776 RepID=A0ABU5L760_9RICK|nr:hypothetical protein [Candidatus Cyrtobacter comes]MDZ5761649.1 hypothetical protein [Candidatus Cyrtobacter comes]
MSFLVRLWHKVTPLYVSTTEHPIHHDIRIDRLALNFYMYKKICLISEFISAFEVAISKAGNMETHSSSLLKKSLEALIFEKSLYEKLCDFRFQSTVQLSNIESLVSYSNFMTVNSIMNSIPVFISAILPYFMVNKEIIELFICIYANNNDDNINGHDAYSDLIVTKMNKIKSLYSAIMDDASIVMKNFTEEQPPVVLLKMEETFLHSVILNWHFIDEVYTEFKKPAITTVKQVE